MEAKAVSQVYHCLGVAMPAAYLQAVYSEEVSKAMGNEPIVQALKELMKYEMAMLVTDDDDDKSPGTSTGKRSNHDNVICIMDVACCLATYGSVLKHQLHRIFVTLSNTLWS